MFQRMFWKRAMSAVTLAAFGSSALFPYPAVAGSGQRQARAVLKAYESAAVDYEEGSFEAFASKFAQGIEGEDLEFLRRNLSNGLPVLRVSGGNLLVSATETSEAYVVKAINPEEGEFLINDRHFRWDPSRSFESNVEDIYERLVDDRLSLNMIWNLLVPSAGAEEAVSDPGVPVFDDADASPTEEVAVPAETQVVNVPEANEEVVQGDAVVEQQEESTHVSSGKVSRAPGGGSSGGHEKKAGMSTTTKVLIGLAIAAVIGLIIWLFMKKKKDKDKKAKDDAASESVEARNDQRESEWVKAA
jgi:hypothetical protein